MITSLAIPPLGCGNGQLEWRAVGPLIYRYVKQMDIPVEMYAPYGTPPKELTVEFLYQAAPAGNHRSMRTGSIPHKSGMGCSRGNSAQD